jgi:ubiquinone/menaquinone biosynthesis C-methylase UbiE
MTQPGHDHPHPHGRVFEFVYVLSMLFGRGALARTVAALARLSTSDVVVDVGCGPGAAVRRARRDGAELAVGIDPSPQMVRLGRWITSVRRMDGVDFVEGSAESLPFDSAGATVVWALQSVHHWEDRSRGLNEALRILARHGRLLLFERAVEPGARGLASHGLTGQQADQLAELIAQIGFVNVHQRVARVGRRNFVVTTARAPS